MEYSTDRGETWETIPLPEIPGADRSVRSITVSKTGWIYGVYGNSRLIRGKIGEKEKEPEPIKIYPNPATEYIIVKNIKEGERVEIYDLLGQIVLSANPGERIDISGFTNGLYYVRVGDFIEKIIKVK